MRLIKLRMILAILIFFSNFHASIFHEWYINILVLFIEIQFDLLLSTMTMALSVNPTTLVWQHKSKLTTNYNNGVLGFGSDWYKQCHKIYEIRSFGESAFIIKVNIQNVSNTWTRMPCLYSRRIVLEMLWLKNVHYIINYIDIKGSKLITRPWHNFMIVLLKCYRYYDIA